MFDWVNIRRLCWSSEPLDCRCGLYVKSGIVACVLWIIIRPHLGLYVWIQVFRRWHIHLPQDLIRVEFAIHHPIKDDACCSTSPADSTPDVNLGRVFWFHGKKMFSIDYIVLCVSGHLVCTDLIVSMGLET